MKHARGEWLAFLDQDDLWTADKLERQSAIIDADRHNRLGIVYCRTACFNAHGRVWPFDRWHPYTAPPEGNIAAELYQKPSFIALSAAVIRRSAAEEIGGIPLNIHFCQDYALMMGVARQYTAACTHQVCCWYRQHESNMTRSSRAEIHREILTIIARHADAVDSKTHSRRARVHESLVGLEEMRAGHFADGCRRVLKSGSLSYLASRPFVVGRRSISRFAHRVSGEGWPHPPTF